MGRNRATLNRSSHAGNQSARPIAVVRNRPVRGRSGRDPMREMRRESRQVAAAHSAAVCPVGRPAPRCEKVQQRPFEASEWVRHDEIPIVPIASKIERRNGYWHRQHLDGHVRRIFFREHRRHDGDQVGIPNHHRKRVKAWHAKCDVAVDLVLCEHVLVRWLHWPCAAQQHRTACLVRRHNQ
jgi:hypothetical protein